MSFNSENKITRIFQNHAKAIIIVATTSFGVGCAQFPVTQNEGRLFGGAVGAILTDGKGQAAQAAGAVLGGVVGGVIADQQVVCRDESSTTRQGQRDNRTGEVTRDQTNQRTRTECEGGRRSQGRVGSTSPSHNPDIF